MAPPESSSVSPLEAHLGYWLRVVSNHVSHRFREKVESRGVTVAEWVVLRKLFDIEPCSPSVLAQGLNLTRGAISKLQERLESKGLLRVDVHPHDGRQQVLLLTRKGKSLVPALAALADENDAACFEVLSEAQRRALQTALEQLVEAHHLHGAAFH
jgi:DNA-binding MarR family transcriptional regulator